MHRVRLRDYLSRIERLIDENRLPEAASHCHHVLRQYPLHVDTYRLYGRVLLEQQQYTKAIDIFERVASGDPEDLTAHAGLALAYKENLNLPKAVWHMERAFEIDPYNLAIREELAELYAARDGYTRDQIDLTRPALARLYFRSKMYREAAAELSSLLRKQPYRYDLKMLLADILYWGDRRADLIDVCLNIIEDMPYSVKANAILAAEWMRNNRPTEANEHWRRVKALTLLTAGSVDPNTTLGRVTKEAKELSFPEEVAVDQLDDETASILPDDRIGEWSSETKEIEGDATMPGWLQEIGFTPEEMAADEVFSDEPVDLRDAENQDQGIDWSELALSIGITDELEKHQVSEDDVMDPVVADLLDMVDDVESSAHDQMIQESLEALVDLETELDEESDSSLPGQLSPTKSLEIDFVDQFVDQSETDSIAEMPISARIDEEPEEWTTSIDDLSELVEELGVHRKGTTAILPPLESVETSQEKTLDWMDDLADSPEVDEVLPDWLYETVGFTDELVEATGEEPAGIDSSIEDEQAKLEEETSDFPQDEGMISGSDQDMMIHDLDQLQDEESDSDSDIPHWLLDADDVLEELPDEVLETSNDDWLGDIEVEDNTAWLEEIEADSLAPSDEEREFSGEGLTGFLSRGLGLKASEDVSEAIEDERAPEGNETAPSDEEDTE